MKVNSSPKPVLHASMLSQIFSVFTRKFVVWNLILCNLCHSNPYCERAYSFDLQNGKHNFAFLKGLKRHVMKWTEQQFEKQSYHRAHVKMHHARYIIGQNDGC